MCCRASCLRRFAVCAGDGLVREKPYPRLYHSAGRIAAPTDTSPAAIVAVRASESPVSRCQVATTTPFRRTTLSGVPPEWLALAQIIVANMPRLENAACAGRWGLFDHHRHKDPHRVTDEASALQLCAHCPALTACKAWVQGLPVWQRPTGVVAGQVVQPPKGSLPTGRPRGRSRNCPA
jgi:WhiB family redox-sensing transcriptional regulator